MQNSVLDLHKTSFDNHEHLIFLISLPRSGSTLLQRILGGSGEIHTTAEPWLMLHPLHAFKPERLKAAYDQQLAASAAADFLSQFPEDRERFYRAVRAYGLTLYNRALEISGKRLFLDKTPRYYSIIPELSQTFPNSRFIILLRNPLAVMSSVLQTWFNNEPQTLSTTSNQRDLIEGPRCLLDGIEMFKDKAHLVHYEKLVSNPENAIRSLCDYLDISFSEEMLVYGDRKAPRGRFGDNVGIIRHNRPVNSSLNKWMQNLTSPKLRPYAVDYLQELGHETITRMGYDFDAISSVLTYGNTSENVIIDSPKTPSIPFPLSSQSNVKEKYEQLLASLRDKDNAAIIEGIRQYLAKHPDFPEAHNDLGVLYAEVGEYDKAYDHYKRAASLDISNSTFQKNMADFQYFIQKDTSSALHTYTTLLKNNPLDTEVLYAIGYISSQIGRHDDAHVFFSRVIEIDPEHYEARCALNSIPNSISKNPPLTTAELSEVPESNTISKGNNPVLVSAIVSVYCAEKFIEGCLENLLSQSIADRIEIIIVDSGSSEDEASIVRRFQDQYDNIHYIRTEQRETVYAAWNRGIKVARGRYITNANCDDRHKPEAFEIMSRTLDQRPEVALVYADCLITETENETFDSCTPVGRFRWLEWDRDALLNRGCFMGPQPMWRRSIHEEYGYFDPEFITSGDYEFWLRISQTHDFYHIPQFLGLYLRSPQSIEHSNREAQANENKRILNLYRKAAKQKNIVGRLIDSGNNAVPIGYGYDSATREESISLYEKGNYDEARNLLVQFLSTHQTDWESHRLLLDVLLQSGQASAIPEQLHALEGRSDLPPYMLALIGSGYEAAGDLVKAADYADQAMSKASDCAQAWNLKGVLAFRNGDLPMAAQHFHTAIENDPDWGEPWTNLGTVYWEQDHHNKALDALEKGCRLSPTAPNVATAYHAAVCEKVQYERAQAVFTDIVERHPEFKKARYLLIDILIRLESYLDALAQIESLVVRFGPDPQLLEAAKAFRAKVGPVTIKKRKRPSLSLCMIVKNEEKYLPRCLESLKPLVDEMIIVDTGSSDATREIAEVFGAKVFDFEWNNDFAAARNYSLKQASGDWILVMDADETISPKDHQTLRHLVRNESKRHAFMMTTRNYTNRKDSADYQENTSEYGEERGTGWVPSRKVRLFRNHQDIYFVFPVHEQVDPVLVQKGAELKECYVPVHHYGKLDRNRTDERWELYYAIGRQKLDALGENELALKELAIQAGLLSRWNEAADYWKRYLALKPESLDACLNLTRVMADSGDYAQALKYARQAFQLNTTRIETHYNLTLSQIHAGEIDQAAQTARQMTAIFPADTDGRLLQAVTEVLSGNLTQGLQQVRRLIREISVETLKGHIYSILKAMHSAGLNDRVLLLLDAFSQIDGLHAIAIQWKGMTTQIAEHSVKIESSFNNRDNAMLEEAFQSFSREAHQAAFDKLVSIIAGNPDHWEAYALLVDLLLQSGRAVEIPERLRPLEERSDLPAWVLALIGNGYEAAGDLLQAANFTRRALVEAPDCARAWNLKGVLAFHSGNMEEAANHFHTAIEHDANWGEPWTNLGTVYWEQNDHKKALDALEKGFNLSPTAPNVATAYHAAVVETDEYERAKPLFEKVVEGHPDFKKARYLLIDILICIESYLDALAQIERLVVQFGPDSELLQAAKAVRAKVGPVTIKKGKRPSLSLCMIVKNEEQYLPRCLESLNPLVNEMIVVDTGSIDATRDIAEVFGAKVFDFEWDDDFAAARNYSLEQASGDWVLVMDADEVIAHQDHKKLLKVLRRADAKPQAFMVVTRNYTNRYNLIGWQANTGRYADIEKGTGWIPSEKVRIFPNNKAIRFDYPVHEVVGPSLERECISVNPCPCPVHHYGKLDDEKERAKDEHYFKIGMSKLAVSQNDPVAIRELAVQAAKLGKLTEAIRLWKRLRDLNPKDPRPYINLSSAYGQQQDFKKAQKAAQKAVDLAPDMKEAHLNLGLSQLHLGKCGAAMDIFRKLTRNHKDYYAATFLYGAAQLCNAEMEAGADTLRSLVGSKVWDNLSYSLQELVESLSGAGWRKLSLNLINGAQMLGCRNETILSHKRKIMTKAA